MSPLPDLVRTVVLVMMENRSFDHMLGHLSYERILEAVNGLKRPLQQYANDYQGDTYPPFRMNDRRLDSDLPHEWDEVAVQLRRSPASGHFTMRGFVEAYAHAIATPPGTRPLPLAFLPASQVPITSFLARQFAPCHRWFASLPTSTQPNRTIAFTGSSPIRDTKLRLIPSDDMIFDWLERNGVRWRVYHDGLSFFTLYPRAIPHVLGPNFEDWEYLYRDLAAEPKADDPQVVIVEPSYQSAPHLGADRPNDNHPPLAVGWGEEFLRRTYGAVRANPTRWASTVMVVYYDEHGGFFDHEPPPSIPYTTTGDSSHTFSSLGPRIPAIVVSPLVEAGVPCDALLEHTSVLQLLAEVFTPGEPYSLAVTARQNLGIGSVASAITRDRPRVDTPPAPSVPIAAPTVLGASLVQPPDALAASFELAARQLLTQEPQAAAAKYPELLQWRDAVDAARGHA